MKFKIKNFQWNTRAEHKRLAALMLVALVALVAGVALMVRIVRMPAPRARPARAAAAATLNLARIDANHRDQARNEEARLFDPAPLFLPTRYNASQIDDTAGARREPGETLPLVDPGYVFSEGTFAIAFPDPYPGPAQPADVLAYGLTPTPYAPFGRLDQPENPLPARLAQLEVIQMKTGRVLLTLTLPPPAQTPATTPAPETAPATEPATATATTPAPAPPAAPATPPAAPPAALTTTNWAPLEFLVSLDVAGLVGAPALVQGSGSTEVDDFFATYLVQTLRLGARRELGAGFYLLRIGP